MMDRTADWIAAIDTACAQANLSPEEIARIKAPFILKPVASQTPFSQAAAHVGKSIEGLDAFIQEHKRDYIAAGRYSDREKDSIEQEVGAVVKTATAQIEQLKNSVLAAQRPPQPGARAQINAETAAHLHGVVLSLVERLGDVSRSFDRCRSVRYSQIVEREQQRRRQLTHTQAVPSKGLSASEWDKENAPVNSMGRGEPGVRLQAMDDLEGRRLLEELASTSQQATSVERSMREISTLNQMISTAVMHQAEQIEQIYSNAVDASTNLRRGNESLRKAVRAGRGAQYYLAVTLLVASGLLLLLDWLYS